MLIVKDPNSPEELNQSNDLIISTAVPELDRIRNHVEIDGDYDFIPVDKKYLKLNSIEGFNSAEITVTNGDLDDTGTNQAIYIHGKNNDGDGVLMHKNVTATVSASNPIITQTVSYTLTDQGIGRYVSDGGDSGAPIIANIDGENKIIGVHFGIGCLFNSTTEDVSIDVESQSIYYECTDTNLYKSYKIISDWGNVVDTFNLR